MAAEYTANAEASTLQESIIQVKHVYMQRGFKINNILMDGQFVCIRGDLTVLHINMNICSNNKHVGEIEQLNCTVKERVRGIYNTIYFKILPGRMVVYLVALVIFWVNAITPPPSVGRNLSPPHIITGLTIEYTKHCRLQFGEYTQVYKYHDNTMQERTTRAIALRPTRNAQGAYFFMSLTTDRRLNRLSFNPPPLPQDVINSVHCLARAAIPEVSTSETGIGAHSLGLRTGPTMTTTIPPTLRRMITTATTTMKVTTMRVMETTTST